MKSLSSGRNS